MLGEGLVANSTEPNGEHNAHGTVRLALSSVTVAKPAGNGCMVYTDANKEYGVEGVIDTAQLQTTTAGQGDFVNFRPAAGQVIETFFIEGCGLAFLNGTYELKGSVKGVPNGTTLNFTHVETTGQGTPTLNGAITAKLDGALTLSVLTPAAAPLIPPSLTTVETP